MLADYHSNGIGNNVDRQVILGIDGGTTSTVCVCMPFIPFNQPLPDPLPVLARAVAGCSNHNSVGGKNQIFFFFLFIFLFWVYYGRSRKL